MEELLSSSEQRELKIIHLLYQEEKLWTVEQLANYLQCSIDTCYRYIDRIKQVFYDYGNEFELISKKTKGVLLKKTEHASLSKYESIYIEETIDFKLLSELFHSTYLTTEKLADHLFISKSTLYRKLKKIAILLRKNGIHLNISTLQLTGNELWIREFFYLVYWSTSDSGFWPFESVPKHVLTHRVENIISSQNSYFSTIEKLKLTYRMAISFIRVQQKNFITHSIGDSFIDPFKEEYFEFITLNLMKTVPSNYQKNEKDYLSLIFCTYPYLDKSDLNFCGIVSWHSINNTIPYQLTDKLLSSLSTIYPTQNLLTNKKLFYQLLCISIYATYFQASFSKTSEFLKLSTLLKQTHTCFYLNTKHALATICQEEPFKRILLQPNFYIHSTIILLSSYVDVLGYCNEIHVRLISSHDRISESLLRNELLRHFPEKISITTSAEFNHQTAALHYDLIITDLLSSVSVDDFSSQYYFWSYPPMKRDWENIATIITTIDQKKHANHFHESLILKEAPI